MPVKSGTIPLADLTGGLNLASSPFSLPLNEATLLQNWYVLQGGALSGRRGTKRFNASSLGSTAVQGSTRAYLTIASPSETNAWLVSIGGTVYVSNDSAGTFVSSLAGLDTTALATFVQYLAFVYFLSQRDAPRKFDGTSWSLMGVVAPSSAPSGSQTTGGTMTAGSYTFSYTNVTATVEGNPSPTSATVVVDTNHNAVSLTGISAGPAGTTSRNVYGFLSGSSSVAQLIGTIKDNTTTTFSVTTPFSEWGQSVPTQNTPPTTGPWVGAQWKGRLWATDQTARLRFSEVFEPEVWPATYYVDIPFLNGETIRAILPLGDLLVVWSQTQLFYVYGTTPFTFVVTASFAENGALSPWAVDRVSNSAVYLSQFGVFAFDGAQETVLSDKIDPQFSGTDPTITALNVTAALNQATLVHYDRLRALVVSFPTSTTVNDTTYWYFLPKKAWVQDTRAVRQFRVAADTGTLWAFDPTAGILRQWDTGTTDDSANIAAAYQSGYLYGDSAVSNKAFDWVTIRGQPGGNPVQVTGYVDEGVESDAFVVTLGSSGSKIGTAVIGTATLQAAFGDYEERWAPNMKGRNIQLRLDVSYSTPVQIVSIFQGLREDGRPRYRGALAT